MISIPAGPGSYLLLLAVEQAQSIQIGRLGEFFFPRGYSVYAGSAFGPGGLAARVGRHLSAPAGHASRWHIDDLRRQAEVIEVGWVEGRRTECEWAQGLLARGGQVIARGFGSSDCRAGCPAHLLFFADFPAAQAALRALAPCSPPGE